MHFRDPFDRPEGHVEAWADDVELPPWGYIFAPAEGPSDRIALTESARSGRHGVSHIGVARFAADSSVVELEVHTLARRSERDLQRDRVAIPIALRVLAVEADVRPRSVASLASLGSADTRGHLIVDDVERTAVWVRRSERWLGFAADATGSGEAALLVAGKGDIPEEVRIRATDDLRPLIRTAVQLWREVGG